MKGDGEFIPLNALKPFGGLGVWLQSLLTLALDRSQWSPYFPGQFTSQGKHSPATTEEQARWVTKWGWDILELNHSSLVFQPAVWSLSDYAVPGSGVPRRGGFNPPPQILKALQKSCQTQPHCENC